jgi:glycerophosphoryl diester phosphodiesterase
VTEVGRKDTKSLFATLRRYGSVVLPDSGTYRNSLSVCWTDVTCPRAMLIGHDGAWSIGSIPYNSNAAISNAYAIGMEGVKIDVRVSGDDIPVVSHSSLIEIYESWDCGLLSLRIEENTAARINVNTARGITPP